jgi:hypothetical protein
MNKILLSVAIFIFQYFMIIVVNAQNRAPSVYLDYNDYDDGNIIINTLRVVEPSPLYTYYNAMCFGGGVDGGGYCGMQNAPDGHNFIFSLWDPVSVHDTIRAEYIGDGTNVANFGGEGTGLRSLNYSIGWLPNQWYTFVTRVWNLNNHSFYGFWIFDHSNNIWHHLVTMNYPVNNLKFSSRTSAFIEDWAGNGSEVREIHRKNGWKRKLNSQWVSFNQATISRVSPDPGCANYLDNYDGGIISNEYYFIKSGGINTHPNTNLSGTTIYLTNSNTSPNFQAGEISNLIVNNHIDSLELLWTVNSSKSPQYSYTVEFYNNSAFTGSPIASFSEINPHTRKTKVRINNLPSGNYFYKIFISDIFDNHSNELTNSFTGLSDIKKSTNISINPNPANNLLFVNGLIGNTKILIFDFSGRLIFNEKVTINQIDISNFQNGIYTIKIETAKETVKYKFVKQ